MPNITRKKPFYTIFSEPKENEPPKEEPKFVRMKQSIDEKMRQ